MYEPRLLKVFGNQLFGTSTGVALYSTNTLLSQHLCDQSQKWKHHSNNVTDFVFNVFIDNSEQISQNVLVFPSLTLNKYIPVG